MCYLIIRVKILHLIVKLVFKKRSDLIEADKGIDNKASNVQDDDNDDDDDDDDEDEITEDRFIVILMYVCMTLF